jgi:hypothetical protein
VKGVIFRDTYAVLPCEMAHAIDRPSSLWALHETKLAIWFKGGTSLSKGFGIIERFSEDLDLMIERGGVTTLPEVANWARTLRSEPGSRLPFTRRSSMAKKHRLARVHVGGRVFFADVGDGWPALKLYPADRAVASEGGGPKRRRAHRAGAVSLSDYRPATRRARCRRAVDRSSSDTRRSGRASCRSFRPERPRPRAARSLAPRWAWWCR